MADRTLRILLALCVLFVATGAALALHACEDHHVPGKADCQVCHWLLAAAAGLFLLAIGIWLHDVEARPHARAVILLTRHCDRPHAAASRAPPRR